jgi:hypothetical protein
VTMSWCKGCLLGWAFLVGMHGALGGCAASTQNFIAGSSTVPKEAVPPSPMLNRSHSLLDGPGIAV